MSILLEGGASDALIAAFLIALKMKGENSAELAGFARAMRERMIPVDGGENLVDTCGTGGGEGPETFNISTVTAFVLAGAGARVAKHGNRSLTSQCGSADVLEGLGIRVTMTPEEAGRAIREVGIGFLFAPSLHPAMKHTQPVRRELKMRTAMNLLGPLSNPAGARAQLVGAPSHDAAQLMAEALADISPETHAFVVHGHDGLDEITTTGSTDVHEVRAGTVTRHLWEPGDFGVHRASLDSLGGGNRAKNAQIMTEILRGAPGERRDIVLVNSAAGLVAADLAGSLREGMKLAARSIDSGAAWGRLEALRGAFPG